MSLLGERNWYLPRWLDRLLPQLASDSQALPKVPAEYRHAA
jgi:RND superfamily putative drug exporter